MPERKPSDEDQIIHIPESEQNLEPQIQPSEYTGEPLSRDPTLVQRTSESILHTRALFGQLIRGDDESKKLILEYLREGIEEKYLEASITTDHTRLDNLRDQMDFVNQGLTAMTGKPTTLIKVYKGVSEKDPDKYQPIIVDGQFNARGFFDFLKFHRELAVQILSTSEVTSERAEIEAQTTLVPLKQELARLVVREQGKTAQEISANGEKLVRAEVLKGEIRTSKIRGMTTPFIKSVAEIPVIVFQAPIDRLAQWMAESEDKAVPIAAVTGAAAGWIILFTKIAGSSEFIGTTLQSNFVAGSVVGIFGGALVTVASWEAVKYSVQAIKKAAERNKKQKSSN